MGEREGKNVNYSSSSTASRPPSRSGRSHNPSPLSDLDASVTDMAYFRNHFRHMRHALVHHFHVYKTLKATKARTSTKPLLSLKEIGKILFLANLKSLSCKLLPWAERRW